MFCRREQGVVSVLNDGFGSIRCVERDIKLMFYFTEVLRSGHELKVGVEVQLYRILSYTFKKVCEYSGFFMFNN